MKDEKKYLEIHKFGGASVKNADSVGNLAQIVKDFSVPHIIVVSAMDKMTNALENVVESYFHQKNDLNEKINFVQNFHFEISKNLFENPNHFIFKELENIFENLRNELKIFPSENYDFEYDKIVSLGEMLSTIIINEYLITENIPSIFVDIRKFLKTNSIFRNAYPDFEISSLLIKNCFDTKINFRYLTQGFIASTPDNATTTLGREGSDYTAAILSYILDSQSVTIWKDVDGVYNADPQIFDFAQKFNEISYQETIELSYFGAKIIHPKTIKPLENKQIPLFVKSFLEPQKKPTIISQFSQRISPFLPVFIVKNYQILISIFPKDFSFIVEENLGKIFQLFAKMQVKINLMEHSAISFSVCIDEEKYKFPMLIKELQKEYKVLYNKELELITIRHYTSDSIENFMRNKTILLEQKSRNNARFVVETKK